MEEEDGGGDDDANLDNHDNHDNDETNDDDGDDNDVDDDEDDADEYDDWRGGQGQLLKFHSLPWRAQLTLPIQWQVVLRACRCRSQALQTIASSKAHPIRTIRQRPSCSLWLPSAESSTYLPRANADREDRLAPLRAHRQ